jgi:hypothetical protein
MIWPPLGPRNSLAHSPGWSNETKGAPESSRWRDADKQDPDTTFQAFHDRTNQKAEG